MRVVVTVVMLLVGLVGFLMSLCGGVTLAASVGSLFSKVPGQSLPAVIAIISLAVGIVFLVMTFVVIRSVWNRKDRA
ncbi:MAG TPA: hypothetical protein VGM97_06425 [Steroidobacteraceae bacterium]|jgi:hypothetical protein